MKEEKVRQREKGFMKPTFAQSLKILVNEYWYLSSTLYCRALGKFKFCPTKKKMSHLDKT